MSNSNIMSYWGTIKPNIFYEESMAPDRKNIRKMGPKDKLFFLCVILQLSEMTLDVINKFLWKNKIQGDFFLHKYYNKDVTRIDISL